MTTGIKIKQFIAWASIIVSFFNINKVVTSCFYKPFGADDVEHAHVIWKTFQGNLIYKDFFEHHGAIYYFVSKILFFFNDDIANFDTLITLRFFSLTLVLLTIVLLFFIVKELTGSYLASLIAISVYTSWNPFVLHAHSIRPDHLHNLLLYLVLFLLIRIKEPKFWHLFLIGIITGLITACNFKMIFFLIALALFYVIEAFIKKKPASLKSLLHISLGFVTFIALISLYFYAQGALKEFAYYNTWFNIFCFKFSPWGVQEALKRNFESFLIRDSFFTLSTFVGIFFLNKSNSNHRLILIVFLISLYGSFGGSYLHYSLIYLPLASFLCAMAFTRIINQANEFKISPILFFVLVTVFITVNLHSWENRQRFGLLKKLTQQRKQLDWALTNIPRDEKVTIVRRGCIASIFFEDRQYFWRAGGSESQAAGKDLWAALPITDKDNRYYFMYPQHKREMNPETQVTLVKEYKLLNLSPKRNENCIWQRK